jgi:hypothetical protein
MENQSEQKVGLSEASYKPSIEPYYDGAAGSGQLVRSFRTYDVGAVR